MSIARDLIQGLAPGAVVGGDFEVVRPLSEGGMGAVYVARQRSTNLERALKLMLPSVALNEELRAKFLREASIGSAIRSEHVVQVVRAGIDETSSSPWLAMELLRGSDLAAFRAKNGRLRPELCFAILEQLAAGLGAAHDARIVHRDLKPENVFIADTGRHEAPFTVKILDFGIAKAIQDAGAAGSMAIGSPLWMAPEQTQVGLLVSPATDVWAYGLVAFFVLTGHPFWQSAFKPNASAVELVNEICFEAIPRASERAAWLGLADALPAGFDAWFARCLSRDASQRFPDAHAAWAHLSSLLRGAAARLPAALELTQMAPGSSLVPPAPLREATARSKQLMVVGIAVAGVAMLGGVGAFAYHRSNGSDNDAASRSLRSAAPASPSSAALEDALRLFDDGADESNVRQALEIARPLCDSGAQAACAIVGDAERRGLGTDKDPSKGLSRLQAACDSKAMNACAYLGVAYDRGEGVPRDSQKAFTLYRSSCEADVAVGCSLLGVAYQDGRGTPKDQALALASFGKACNGGSVGGCALLGFMYSSGRAVAKDLERAVALFKQACDAGSARGCVALGYNLEHGRGAGQDAQRAAQLYAQACERANAVGCNNLAELYRKGKVFPKDLAYAAKLYGQSCDKGELLGCHNLGLAYRFGEGVPKDPTRALKLFRDACDAGLSRGCTDLGLLYQSGVAVNQDESQAAMLFQKGCDGGHGYGCSKLGEVWEAMARKSKSADQSARHYADARSLYTQACEGDAMAGCINLGLLCAEGRGAARDESRAVELLRRACDGKAPRGCNELGLLYERPRQMTADRKRAAELYAIGCKDGFAPACENQRRLGPKP